MGTSTVEKVILNYFHLVTTMAFIQFTNNISNSSALSTRTWHILERAVVTGRYTNHSGTLMSVRKIDLKTNSANVKLSTNSPILFLLLVDSR